jgi:hypothetical protein
MVAFLTHPLVVSLLVTTVMFAVVYAIRSAGLRKDDAEVAATKQAIYKITRGS